VRDLAQRLEVKKVPDALDDFQLPMLELARVVVRRRHDAPVVCACRWSSGVESTLASFSMRSRRPHDRLVVAEWRRQTATRHAGSARRRARRART
jgi:hypothetical protein